ncbi:hypothetical protein [Nostoc sp.]
MSKFGAYGLLAYQCKQSLKNWGVARNTVYNYLRNSTFTERRQRSDQGLSLLNPYQDYLLSRWNSGSFNTQELFEEIRQAGLAG